MKQNILHPGVRTICTTGIFGRNIVPDAAILPAENRSPTASNRSINVITDFIITITPDKKIISINNAVKSAIKDGDTDIINHFVNNKKIPVHLSACPLMISGIKRHDT